VYLHSFLTSALDGGEWSTSRPAHITPGNELRYPLNRISGGPQGWSGCSGEETMTCPARIQTADRATSCMVAIPTALFSLHLQCHSTIIIKVLCDVTPYSLVDMHKHFGKTYCLHYLGHACSCGSSLCIHKSVLCVFHCLYLQHSCFTSIFLNISYLHFPLSHFLSLFFNYFSLFFLLFSILLFISFS
jgi:hypothetical protein